MQVKAETYEGKKSVYCVCKDCPKYRCFSPHNIARHSTYGDGKKRKAEWVCLTNHNNGCPEKPQPK